MPHRVVAPLALALAAGVLVGCTSAGMPTPTPTPTPTPSGDGVLRIGTLFPSSGATVFIAPAQVAGVNAAIREINAAGGVLGSPVEVHHRDSSDASTEKAEQSFAELVSAGVDVVIGPSSSGLAERLLGPAEDAGIPMISPAATYPALTTLDEADVLFRTIGSYPHQAVVLADLFADQELDRVALVFRDDDLGASLAAAFESALADLEIDLALVEVTAESDAAAVAAEVADAAPGAVVLATPDNADQTKALITQISAAGYGGAKLWLTSQNLADYSQALPGGLLNGVNGVIQGAEPDAAFQARLKVEDPGLTLFRYAAEAYDATILAALAATLAGDDGSASLVWRLRDASTGGIKCTSYGECLDVLTTQSDIDYDGVSGSVNLDAAGEPERGSYAIVTYNGENKFTTREIRIG